MKVAAIILLAVLVVWWMALTVFIVRNHRKRARKAKSKPMTEAQKEDYRRHLEETRHPVRPVEFLVAVPFAVVMLPFYIYGWLIGDPYHKQSVA
jgi:hypothetical protein